MITSNVIHRTFHIRYGNITGTGFAIERCNRQYLITAQHVVEGITSGRSIEVLHERQWKTLPIQVIGIGVDPVDVAVLACPVRLAPAHPLVASTAGLAYGQQVFFLGYPFGWDSGHDDINRDIPMPFAKAGIVSAMINEDASRIFIDAHGNKGFSGGPVVFCTAGPASE